MAEPDLTHKHPDHSRIGSRSYRYRAFSVHVFTASGAAIAFLSLTAAIEHQMGLAFAWLGLALLVDGIDGSLLGLGRLRPTRRSSPVMCLI